MKWLLFIFILFFVSLNSYANDACNAKVDDIINAQKGQKLNALVNYLSSPEGQGIIGGFTGGSYYDKYGNLKDGGKEAREKAEEECLRKSLSAEEFYKYKQNKEMQEKLERQQQYQRYYQEEQLYQMQQLNNNLRNIDSKLSF